MPPMPSFFASAKEITLQVSPADFASFFASPANQLGVQMLGGVAAMRRASFTLAPTSSPRTKPSANAPFPASIARLPARGARCVALPSNISTRQLAIARPSPIAWPSSRCSFAPKRPPKASATFAHFIRSSPRTSRAPAVRADLALKSAFLPRPRITVPSPAAVVSPSSARKLADCAAASREAFRSPLARPFSSENTARTTGAFGARTMEMRSNMLAPGCAVGTRVTRAGRTGPRRARSPRSCGGGAGGGRRRTACAPRCRRCA